MLSSLLTFPRLCIIALATCLLTLSAPNAYADTLDADCARPGVSLAAAASVANTSARAGLVTEYVSTATLVFKRCGAPGSVRNLTASLVSANANDQGQISGSEGIPLSPCSGMCAYEPGQTEGDGSGSGRYQLRATTPFRAHPVIVVRWTDATTEQQLTLPLVLGSAPAVVSARASKPRVRSKMATFRLTLATARYVEVGPLRVCVPRARPRSVFMRGSLLGAAERPGCWEFSLPTLGVNTVTVRVPAGASARPLTLVVTAPGMSPRRVTVLVPKRR